MVERYSMTVINEAETICVKFSSVKECVFLSMLKSLEREYFKYFLSILYGNKHHRVPLP